MPNKLLYNPLNTEAAEFRLLTILLNEDDELPVQCSLETCSLSQPPPYHALSYVWGDPGVAAEIIINDTPFQATRNLEQALRTIRYRLKNELGIIFRTNRTNEVEAAAGGPAELRLSTSTEYRIWVDAVCINQQDVYERNRQVALMKDIYSSAHRVLVWFGPGDRDTDWLFEICEQYKKGDILQKLLPSDDARYKTVITFWRISERPWWSRVWVLQEFVVARNDPVFLCGFRSTRSERFFNLYWELFYAIIKMNNATDRYCCFTKFKTCEMSINATEALILKAYTT
jgi:hypothetical protein